MPQWTIELLQTVALLCGSGSGNPDYRASVKLDCPAKVIKCVDDKNQGVTPYILASCVKELGK